MRQLLETSKHISQTHVTQTHTAESHKQILNTHTHMKYLGFTQPLCYGPPHAAQRLLWDWSPSCPHLLQPQINSLTANMPRFGIRIAEHSILYMYESKCDSTISYIHSCAVNIPWHWVTEYTCMRASVHSMMIVTFTAVQWISHGYHFWKNAAAAVQSLS